MRDVKVLDVLQLLLPCISLCSVKLVL